MIEEKKMSEQEALDASYCAQQEMEEANEEKPFGKDSDVPGQQIGMYGDESKGEVQQMVKILNSPEEENQKDRG